MTETSTPALVIPSWSQHDFEPLQQFAARRGVEVLDMRVSTTAEGEYALVARCRRGGQQVILGLVYGDDKIDVIEQTTIANAERAIQMHSLGLPVRPRRYLHKAPSGWSWRGDHRVSIYESPDGDAAIAVYATLPGASVDHAWAFVTKLLGAMGTRIKVAFDGVPLVVGSMSGRMRELDGELANGEPARWAFAALSDGNAAYPLLMTAPTTMERRRAEFAALVDSITPLPRRIPPHPLAHWAD